MLTIADEKTVDDTLRISVFGQDTENLCYIESLVRTLRESQAYRRKDVSVDEAAHWIAESLQSLVRAMPTIRFNMRFLAFGIMQQQVAALFPDAAVNMQESILEAAVLKYTV